MPDSSIVPPQRGHFRPAAFAWPFFAAIFALRLFYVFRYRLSTDEPQHLHVAWGWANGFLQYRDMFDNHAPLFHMLSAPAVALFGERPDLLVLMRLTMLPLFALCLWCVYRIGRAVFSREAGIWAAVITGLIPQFFLSSLEYRADVLWAVSWLAVLVVLVERPLTPQRGFVAGLLLGATAAISLKTTFLALSMIAAAGVTMLVALRGRSRRDLAQYILRTGLAAVAGMLIVPALLVGFFWAEGALSALYYCTIEHNTVEGLTNQPWNILIAFAACSAVVAPIIMKLRNKHKTEAPALRQIFFVVLTGALPVTLSSWPLVPRQDYLPIIPVVIVAAVAGLQWLLARKRAFLPVAGTLAALLLAFAAAQAPRDNAVAPRVQKWRDVLQLTDPGQQVMDAKGELIFRPRSFYYVLEVITLSRIDMGLIKDDIVRSLIDTRTCVVDINYRMPEKTQSFIRDNYISVGSLMVTGKHLQNTDGRQVDLPFDVRIPARYAIVTPGGNARGMIDGQAYRGPVKLTAGRHTYRPTAAERQVALVWAQAVERGFRPFLQEGEQPN